MLNSSHTNYRWYVLTLAALTGALALMMPEMCMSVLFAEIAEELDLNPVQIGTVWGIVPLGSVFFLLAGGVLCDRFGVKRTMGTACLLAGIIGAMRGLQNGFAGLVIASFFLGLLSSLIAVSIVKSNRLWFPDRQLGLANGVTHTGVGIGATLSSMISATYLSPLLGGWRNVLFLYGAISMVLGIIWFLTSKEPRYASTTYPETTVPFRQAIPQVLRNRAVWLLGLTCITYLGSMMAIVGYLPLYLRESGWAAIHADGALTTLNLAGTAGTIPLAMLSDRLGRRKLVLVPAAIVAIICAGLLSTFSNAIVWGAALMLGACHTSFAAIVITMCLEIKGIGIKYSGITLGLIYTLQRVGMYIAPPLGNSFASINPGMPFVFWASLLSVGAIILIFFVKETGWKVKRDHTLTDSAS